MIRILDCHLRFVCWGWRWVSLYSTGHMGSMLYESINLPLYTIHPLGTNRNITSQADTARARKESPWGLRREADIQQRDVFGPKGGVGKMPVVVVRRGPPNPCDPPFSAAHLAPPEQEWETPAHVTAQALLLSLSVTCLGFIVFGIVALCSQRYVIISFLVLCLRCGGAAPHSVFKKGVSLPLVLSFPFSRYLRNVLCCLSPCT